MLFFKQKQKSDEILPPPPPFPTMEFEEEKPKFFDEVITPKKAETFPEEEEFSSLVEDLERGAKQKKPQAIKKISLKKKLKPKQKIPKIMPRQLKKLAKVKQIKKIKTSPEKIKKVIQKSKPKLPELEEDFKFKDIDFELPKELEEHKGEIELPETLEEFGMDSFGQELKQETKKPKEILEAEEEIKSAIEQIKKQEKPSLFKRFFERKKAEEMPEQEGQLIQDRETNGISRIQNSINKARDALMKFDLEAAKKSYIEIMRIYNNLNPEDKAKVYNEIKELYSERKSAEELKI